MRKLERWVEIECTLHGSPRSSEMSDCNRPFQKIERYYSMVNPLPMGYGTENGATL